MLGLYFLSSSAVILLIFFESQRVELSEIIHTENMIADIGTRKGAPLSNMQSDSEWINSFRWMKDNE